MNSMLFFLPQSMVFMYYHLGTLSCELLSLATFRKGASMAKSGFDTCPGHFQDQSDEQNKFGKPQ